METVTIQSLSKTYTGGKEALKQLSLSLSAGEVFGFLGPNGAGKTTTVKLLTGVLTPSGGSCEILGVNPHTQPEKAHLLSGIVTEHAQMYNNLTGIENLLFYATAFGLKQKEGEQRGELLLRELDLMEAKDRKLATYSTGMRLFDLLSFGGVHPDGKERKGYSKDYIHSFSAVMQQSFRFAVFPKQYITFNPMQYIKLRYQTDEVDLFSDEDMDGNIQPISREDYERLLAYLQKKNPAAILPIQIAYYAGLRIGEACGLAWQDVNLEEQCLTIRRSIRYDGSKRKYIIGPTKRKKVRIVDFGDTLVEIFRNTRKEQLKNRMQYGELYHTNYYKEVKEKNRVYYEYYCLDRTEEVPADYKEISFV